MNLSAHLQEKLSTHLRAFGIKDLDPEVKKLLLQGAEAKAQKVLDEAEDKAFKAASGHIKTITLKRVFDVLKEVSTQGTSQKSEVTSGQSSGSLPRKPEDAPASSKGVPPATGGVKSPPTTGGHPTA